MPHVERQVRKLAVAPSSPHGASPPCRRAFPGTCHAAPPSVFQSSVDALTASPCVFFVHGGAAAGDMTSPRQASGPWWRGRPCVTRHYVDVSRTPERAAEGTHRTSKFQRASQGHGAGAFDRSIARSSGRGRAAARRRVDDEAAGLWCGRDLRAADLEKAAAPPIELVEEGDGDAGQRRGTATARRCCQASRACRSGTTRSADSQTNRFRKATCVESNCRALRRC